VCLQASPAGADDHICDTSSVYVFQTVALLLARSGFLLLHMIDQVPFLKKGESQTVFGETYENS
jgi:hypothetical protein